jgi:hypothetical protein
MLAEARDLLAVMVLEKRLGEARERLAERALAGEVVTPEMLAATEREALDAVRKEYYTAAVRRLVKPKAAALSDADDAESRGQRLAEHATLFSHRVMLAIPLAGDPRLDPPADPADPAAGQATATQAR